MRRNLLHSRQIVVVCIITLLAACRITRPFQLPPDVVNNDLYRDIRNSDTNTIATIPWQQFFTDTILQALLQEGIDNNPDIDIAVARIEQAAATYRQSRLAYFPTLNATTSATQQKVPATRFGASEVYDVYLSTSWEIDIWGKFRSTQRANRALLLQSEAFRRAVQTQLVADIATAYFALLAYDRQLQITEQTVAIRIQDVATVKALKESDFATGADVVQSEANRYSAEVTIPDIKRNIRETENILSTLLGRVPGPIPRSTLEAQQVTADLKTGIPALLLANRPDVLQAEYQLRYYFELTNVARTYFYPTLTITGQAGFSSTSLSNLLDAGGFFAGITEGLTQPIFNQGINRARLRTAEAQQREFLAAFRLALLTAGQEVSNALNNYQAAAEKISSRSQQIHFLNQAVDFTKELLRAGWASINYTDVLTSEQNLLTAQLNGINDRLQQLQAVVNLYRSLGGGWR